MYTGSVRGSTFFYFIAKSSQHRDFKPKINKYLPRVNSMRIAASKRPGIRNLPGGTSLNEALRSGPHLFPRWLTRRLGSS